MFGNAVLYTQNGGASRNGMHWQNGSAGAGLDLTPWRYFFPINPRLQPYSRPRSDLLLYMGPAAEIRNISEFEEDGKKFTYVRYRLVLDHKNLIPLQTGGLYGAYWGPTGATPAYGYTTNIYADTIRLYGPIYYDYEGVFYGKYENEPNDVPSRETLFAMMTPHLIDQLKQVHVNVDTADLGDVINFLGHYPLTGGYLYTLPINPEIITEQTVYGTRTTYLSGTKFTASGRLDGPPASWMITSCTVFDDDTVQPHFGLPDFYGWAIDRPAETAEYPLLNYDIESAVWEKNGNDIEYLPYRKTLVGQNIVDIDRYFGNPQPAPTPLIPVFSKGPQGVRTYATIEPNPRFYRTTPLQNGKITVEAAVAHAKISLMHA